MHELSIAQSAIELAEQAAEGRRITRVTLEVGELSGVVAEALAFCFELATEGTLAEGAALEMRVIAGLVECQACSNRFPIHSRLDQCDCGSSRVRVLQGEELHLKSLELL